MSLSTHTERLLDRNLCSRILLLSALVPRDEDAPNGGQMNDYCGNWRPVEILMDLQLEMRDSCNERQRPMNPSSAKLVQHFVDQFFHRCNVLFSVPYRLLFGGHDDPVVDKESLDKDEPVKSSADSDLQEAKDIMQLGLNLHFKSNDMPLHFVIVKNFVHESDQSVIVACTKRKHVMMVIKNTQLGLLVFMTERRHHATPMPIIMQRILSEIDHVMNEVFDSKF